MCVYIVFGLYGQVLVAGGYWVACEELPVKLN